MSSKGANLRPIQDVLWEAQRGRCWICQGQMQFYGLHRPEGATLDHVWPKSRYKAIGDIGVTLLAHRGCNANRGNPLPSDDEIRALIRTWRKVDRHWLRMNLSLTEAAIRTVETQRARAELLRTFAEAA